MRVVSFAQDLIYDVTRCMVRIPERVGLAVLLIHIYWFSRTLCKVGDSPNIPNGILLDVKNVLCGFPSIGDINAYDSF